MALPFFCLPGCLLSCLFRAKGGWEEFTDFPIQQGEKYPAHFTQRKTSKIAWLSNGKYFLSFKKTGECVSLSLHFFFADKLFSAQKRSRKRKRKKIDFLRPSILDPGGVCVVV